MAISSKLNYACMRRACKFARPARSATQARSAGCESSLIRVDDLKGGEKKEREEGGRKAPRTPRIHALGSKSSGKQSAAGTPTVIYNKQLEVFTGVCDSRL